MIEFRCGVEKTKEAGELAVHDQTCATPVHTWGTA